MIIVFDNSLGGTLSPISLHFCQKFHYFAERYNFAKKIFEYL